MEKLNNNLLQQKLTSLPFRKIAPNIVTTLALCAGVTSMRYAIMGLWGKAIVCIFLAALFDMLDGRVARMLKDRPNSARTGFAFRLRQFRGGAGHFDVSVDVVQLPEIRLVLLSAVCHLHGDASGAFQHHAGR